MLRERYRSIVRRLNNRIDQASYDMHTKGCDRARLEYLMLCEELSEIKEAILESEES